MDRTTDPGTNFGPKDIWLVPFSLLWGGFSTFWVIVALLRAASPWSALFGLPFVLFGLYFIIGRFFYNAARKRRRISGLTSGRALVSVGAASLSDSPVQRTVVEQNRSRNGRHLTVTFGRGAGGMTSGAIYANTGMDFFERANVPFGFYDVSDVSGLEAALMEARH